MAAVTARGTYRRRERWMNIIVRSRYASEDPDHICKVSSHSLTSCNEYQEQDGEDKVDEQTEGIDGRPEHVLRDDALIRQLQFPVCKRGPQPGDKDSAEDAEHRKGPCRPNEMRQRNEHPEGGLICLSEQSKNQH